MSLKVYQCVHCNHRIYRGDSGADFNCGHPLGHEWELIMESNMEAKMHLTDFTDEQLRQEISRREHERDLAEKIARKAKEVQVECPECHGRGEVRNGDVMRVASGEDHEYLICRTCKGKKTIIAIRA